MLDLPADYFNYLSEMLEQADLKEKPLNAKLKNIIGRKGNEVTKNNVIPISIINSEALLLTKEQVVANQDAKKNNKKADSKDYETIEFIAAGLLQSEAFQGNLSFEIDPSVIINNLDNTIKGISIDFNEGKGFQDYDWKQQTISYQFTSAGDKNIKIKLSTKKGIYITNCPLKIHFLNRPIPSYTGMVSSTSVKGGRVAANVVGAEYQIFNGCDGILDKPIIIAEGFDADNDVNIDFLVSKYQFSLRSLTNNGYDLVFVNYNDGTDFIENNAQALKRVINDINAKKVGSGEINKLSIIGESMSGLIARWALREMENAGQNHQVARLICFDTPHRGANTSPGLSYLAKSLNSRGVTFGGLIRVMFNAFAPALNAIETPASRQQLLFQTWDMNPHPDYATFRTNLNNLGNGGYPSQCKNIAFLNGALDGRFNNRFPNRYNANTNDPVMPGEKILDTDIVWGICYDFVDCWTNQVNVNTEVYNEDAFGFLCDWTFASRSINLPYNLDRLAGGFNINRSDLWGQFTSTRPNFSFVPTFSSVDYRGTLNTDADYSININNWLDGNRQVRADRQNLTPFRAIYGNNQNFLHSYISGEIDAIEAMAINEFGINPVNINNGCIGCTTGSGGLRGTYFNNIDLMPNGNTQTNVREMDYSSDENRHTVNGSFTLPNPPFEIITRENISARWEGSFEAPISGTYNLNVRTDDGVRVWVDGVGKVNDWGYYGPTDHPFQEFFFNAGERRNIRIDWFQGGGGYEAKFMWSFNGVQSIVPACRLFPTSVVISTDCNFTISASASPSSVGCGGTSALSAGCTGSGCAGVSYAWSGNGNNYNGSPVAVTFPNSNGAVSYTLTGSKTGCSNKTANVSVNVSGCGGGSTTSTCTVNKVRLSFRTDCCLDRLQGAKIQGSNGNNTWTDIYTFNQNAAGGWQDFIFANSVAYNTVRFQSSATGYGELGGLEFYNNTTKLSGTAIGSAAAAINIQNGFDFWHGTAPGIINYAGLQLSGCTGGGSGGGTPTTTLTNNNCYTIQSKINGQYMQAMGDNSIQKQTANNASNQVWKAVASGNSFQFLSQSNQQPIKCDNYNFGHHLSVGSGGNNLWNLETNNSSFRVSSPNNVTWDMDAAGAGAFLQLYGNTTEGFADYRLWNFTQAACTTTSPPTTCATGNFTGFLDNASCGWISGWSLDNNNLGRTVQVDIFVDGQKVATVDANQNRPDLQPAFNNNPAAIPHGYSYVPPSNAWWKNGQNHTVTARPCGGTQDLSASPKTVNCAPGSRIASSEESDEKSVEVYPNPTTGKVKVGFYLLKDESVWLNLYDSQSRNLQIKDFEGKNGYNLIEIDLQDYPSGAYFINLQSSQKREVKKVMKVD
jgi:PA14 domain/Secretion system C-terminal sorting domain